MTIEVNVSKRRGTRTIAAKFVAPPGVTALVGPSGAGKTTILNMIAGMLAPDSGRIVADGEMLFDGAAGIDRPPDRRRAGYVYQDGRLFPHMRVRANLLYGWKLAAPEHRWMQLEEAVGFLGIGALLDRWPRSLSGGEAQRVGIGRALLSGPRFLLMDEPLASLDPDRRDEIMRVIEQIRDELRLPILYVSHDRAEVARLADQVIEL